jgi:hypothetical protein
MGTIRWDSLDAKSKEIMRNGTQSQLLTILSIFENEELQAEFLEKALAEKNKIDSDACLKTYIFLNYPHGGINNVVSEMTTKYPYILDDIEQRKQEAEEFTKKNNSEFRALIEKEDKTQEDHIAINDFLGASVLEKKLPTSRDPLNERISEITRDSLPALKEFAMKSAKYASYANMVFNPASIVSKIFASSAMTVNKWLLNGGYDRFIDKVIGPIDKFEEKNNIKKTPIDKFKHKFYEKARSALTNKKAKYAAVAIFSSASVVALVMAGDIVGTSEIVADLNQDIMNAYDSTKAFAQNTIETASDEMSQMYESGKDIAQEKLAVLNTEMSGMYDSTKVFAENTANAYKDAYLDMTAQASETISEVYEVTEGDNLNSVVENLLPEGTTEIEKNDLINEIAKMNNIDSGADLVAGANLDLPASLTDPDLIDYSGSGNDYEGDNFDGVEYVNTEGTTSYDIQKGDNLYNISESILPEGATEAQKMELVNKIVEMNGIENPDLIFAGASIEIPVYDAGVQDVIVQDVVAPNIENSNTSNTKVKFNH